jgi:hypothetical protein
MQRTVPELRRREAPPSICHFCPNLRGHASTSNRGNIKRVALVTPTQLSPSLLTSCFGWWDFFVHHNLPSELPTNTAA